MTTFSNFFGIGFAPVPSGATPSYQATIVDQNGAPLGSTFIDTLTLSIVDTTSKAIINNCSQVNILNTGRGSLDASGNLIINLLPADTALYNVNSPKEERSLVIDWSYNGGVMHSAHQVNFQVVALAGP